VDARSGPDKQSEVEEQSLGDFRKYSQKNPTSALMMGQSKTIPEESLGSFAAFHKKYEQEKLLGLHDDPGSPSQDESMDNMMSPMKQYGGTKPQSSPLVEESLGSFTQFAQKYEEDKLLGLHDSSMTSPPPVPEEEVNIPEESMGDFVGLAAKDPEPVLSGKKKHKKKGSLELDDSGFLEDDDEKDDNFQRVELPGSRIQKLAKRGGVGYRIMVDTPGGHSPQPMKIVVAIEFDDETTTECEEEEEDPYSIVARLSHQDLYEKDKKNAPESPSEKADNENNKEHEELASQIENSAHLPLTPLEDDKEQIDRGQEQTQSRRKQHTRKPEDSGGAARQRRCKLDDVHEEDEDKSEGQQDPSPLASHMNRWNQSAGNFDARAAGVEAGGLQKQHHVRSENSQSTHSTMSSITMEGLSGHGKFEIQSDSCPSSHLASKRPPSNSNKPRAHLSKAGGLKRPSTVVPHNLGTRRGLMFRQQSEASMMSTKSSDSSTWCDINVPVPEDYQASFMQLNLMDLDKTQMQTNEEVDKAELPNALPSGIEGIEKSSNNLETIDESIPEGKQPQIASAELLGMKTMLKHIKRVAPNKSRSFDFDRDTPKAMWNKMFARSQKGELPGSEYVDKDESNSNDNVTSDNAEEKPVPVEESTRQDTEGAGEQAEKDGTSKKKSTFMKVINRVTSSGVPSSSGEKEKSSSKGKSSLWSSAIKRVVPSNETDQDEDQEDNQNQNDEDVSEGSLDHDLQGHEEEKEGDPLQANVSGNESDHSHGRSGHRRRIAERREDRREGSQRGEKSGHSRTAKGGPTGRGRNARAQQLLQSSLRDSLDYYTTENDDQGKGQDDLPKLDPVDEKDAEAKTRRARPRPRRKPPLRTKSDESGAGFTRTLPSRTHSTDGARLMPNRTRSSDSSPPRTRAGGRRMHESFSGLKSSDLPERAGGKKTIRRTRSEDETGRDVPPRIRPRGDTKRIRPVRKKSGVSGAPGDETSGHSRAIVTEKLPDNATEEELREILDYH
jgi:hypothetical protein